MIIDRDKVRMIMAKKNISFNYLVEKGITKNLFLKSRELCTNRTTTVHKLAKVLGVEVDEILK